MATSSTSPRIPVIAIIGFSALWLASRWWLALVDKYVPEPYLDEVFHIPQAQTYCAGRFWDWDDKITTPPGLYLLSVAYHKLRVLSECTPLSLRSNNLLATVLTALLAAQCRHLIEIRAAERDGKQASGAISFNSYYTGLNIALFPVIFFFSALYYTDIISTLFVLVAYRNHLLRLGPHPPSIFNDLWTVALGICALFMRQTNIFWVVVYMGGLEAVHVLRSVQPAAQTYYKLHDPPLNQSGPEDWFFCVLGLGLTALSNPIKVIRQIWPHLTILAMFAGFVFWNGGVVLGDKSNHIATIHLAQMLYLWPLLAFFSAPLLIPSILCFITRPIQYLRSLLSLTSGRAVIISIPYTLFTVFLSLAVAQYNTIIHPFTLADNRHYMFYVFRYTILRSHAVRLSLIAAYTVCRWLVWDQLAGPSQPTWPQNPQNPSLIAEKTTASENSRTPASHAQKTEDPDATTATSWTSPSTSTALLWLLATALSLITAPLVEPRYFILPWVFYRLLVPAWRATDAPLPTRLSSSRLWRVVTESSMDVRLVLETIWFVLINVGTMYVFLFKGFYWRGEDGEFLDGGRVQRFMW
ncbi:glycosyltransferase [Corynascus novoguineensis]|uniref:Dol-P-Glc:Glc(2)Man(9)GlcNAc(2)-PP-Dol alpha-1,2-glucosyltransferase n=1 Tax=Corynascus novoguineensis TaxID=1126955 RepID=A0AAN7CMD6_9PEZI|nr:glycosyltransferase [Corynascus novoguineensis]